MKSVYRKANLSVSVMSESQRQSSIFRHLRPEKIKISLRIRAVWSKSSLCAFWIAKNAMFLRVDNEDFDQAVWIYRLI